MLISELKKVANLLLVVALYFSTDMNVVLMFLNLPLCLHTLVWK